MVKRLIKKAKGRAADTLSAFERLTDLPEQKRKTQQRILAGLKKMGVATLDETSALESKIRKLESSLGTKSRSKPSRARS